MATVICPADNFGFVHIPKCGGASVEMGLEEAFSQRRPDDVWLSGDLIDHPDLGAIIPAHKPLQLMADHYPDEMALLRQVRCFAVARDPELRFVSAFQQHLRQFRRLAVDEIDHDEGARILDDCMNALNAAPIYTGGQYVHFTRQVDYVRLGDETIVGDVFALENLGDLARAMSAHVGREVRFQDWINMSAKSPTPVLSLARQVGKALRPILPTSAYHRLRNRLELALGKPPPDYVMALFGSETVKSFVSDFYADDAHLHAAALARKP